MQEAVLIPPRHQMLFGSVGHGLWGEGIFEFLSGPLRDTPGQEPYGSFVSRLIAASQGLDPTVLGFNLFHETFDRRSPEVVLGSSSLQEARVRRIAVDVNIFEYALRIEIPCQTFERRVLGGETLGDGERWFSGMFFVGLVQL